MGAYLFQINGIELQKAALANFEAPSKFGKFAMTFASRLQSIVDGHSSANAFAHHVGIGQSLLRKYLAGANPGLDKVIQIAKATGVSINWLATGDDGLDSLQPMVQSMEPLRTQQEQKGGEVQHFSPQSLEAEGLILLPRIDTKASAGRGVIPQSETVMGFVAFQESYLRSIGVNPRFAHILQISGDSMEPILFDQDWVVVDTSIDRVVDEAIYAVVYGEVVLAKRIQMLRDGGLILSSDNKSAGYVDEHIKPEDLHTLHIVGRVKTRTHLLY